MDINDVTIEHTFEILAQPITVVLISILIIIICFVSYNEYKQIKEKEK